MPPTYTFLASHDKQGYPSNTNLDESNADISQSVSTQLINEINNTLSESKSITETHPDWIKKADIKTVKDCEIQITFVGEQAGYKNALSYYVYDPTDPPTRFQDIDNIYIIFPNASKVGSGGLMSPGDTIKLAYEVTSSELISNKRYATTLDYLFPANKCISFVIHANRWKNNNTNYAYLATNHWMYSSDPVLNGENQENLKQHFVAFKSESEPDKIIYGCEDIMRTHSNCDHDFNDLLYYVTPTPFNAIDTSSYNSNSQQTFKGTVMCEDLLNKINADLDYDDFCVEYKITENI